MEEILYELRDHAAGLNAGRWDYLFSIIKNFRDGGPRFVLPDRNAGHDDRPVHAGVHRTARPHLPQARRARHRRHGGLHPVPRDAEVNKVALEKVRADKDREAGDGFDGSWVAHPDLVADRRESSTRVLGDRRNQKDRLREDVAVTRRRPARLDRTPRPRHEAGLRTNVPVGIRYIEAWLRGIGAVAIFNLMEDAATAEISRSQIWQWIRHDAALADGRKVSRGLVEHLINIEAQRLMTEVNTGQTNTGQTGTWFGQSAAPGGRGPGAAGRTRLRHRVHRVPHGAGDARYLTWPSGPSAPYKDMIQTPVQGVWIMACGILRQQLFI